ncbi:uncharacterized protein FA14DRAFT_160738 [Meira miltonrushii]|uniref:mRNA decay factor PAT1 domain-containing protein n=1 Tax=Meira miltonrushii TaxID=1280837 RepID=A0A316VDQ0_9BASI|nr:uncharacterized protein FA14DRAFT_160738 [Meira miltonrushii]PWN35702.1 hypothetical protein FA14DRAFT_160738 [Meira miltonrushii]
MSFFGFDTSLPRDRNSLADSGDKTLDPFDPTDQLLDDDDDAAFEEKLRGLRAAGQEDVEIYTWGGGGEGDLGDDDKDDGLGDLLDETGDAFNDDTFGMGNVGKDFDFGGTGGKQTSLPAFFEPDVPKGPSGFGQVKKNDAAFASTMDDFWRMPGPPSRSAVPASSGPSLDEIEAQMRNQRNVPAPSQPLASAPPTEPQAQRKPLTMEEVEAEMRARRSQAPPAAEASKPQAVPGRDDSAFPALGSAPPRPQQAPPQVQPVQVQLPIPPMPNPNDPNLQQLLFQRMRIMLETLPNPIQGRIMSLPPYMHFGITDSVVRDFPALTVAASPEKLPQQIDNPRLWPRIDGSPEEQNTIRFMVDTALAKIDEAFRQENKRQVRISKIQSMAPRNNLMSRSDKDFITRIQVSQLISSDPYTDDFYAHIYFALHGNRSRVTLPASNEEEKQKEQKKVEESTNGQDNSNAQQGEEKQKKARQRKTQPNRRETAMLRMQQQVERIVQNRKERIEKAGASASLEGALGRVSLGTTKAPRQMLQINQDGTEAGSASPPTTNGAAKNDGSDVTGTGHAQNAAQQALQGASLAQGGVQKRPALNKLEVLTILEKLYDIVLNLEQSRRTAPADVSEQNNDPAAVEWRQQRDVLASQLWQELRVLEPLEVSDPHPFVSLLSTVKGKRILPRALRHLSSEQTLTAMTMIVASFDRLDVVRESVVLDEPVNTKASPAAAERRANVQRQTEAFVTSIVPGMLSLMATVPMRIVSGMLALFLERNNPVRVAQSKPGVAFLTIFLSRAASLRQSAPSLSSPIMSAGGLNKGDGSGAPSPADLAQWNEIFNLLIQRLAQPPEQLVTLFPSTRAKARLPFGAPALDGARKAQLEVEDRDIWQLMAAIAVSANMTQQQILVTGLREKILENVLEAKQWSAANPIAASHGEADLRIRNVNLLLHALNLDAAQITV